MNPTFALDQFTASMEQDHQFYLGIANMPPDRVLDWVREEPEQAAVAVRNLAVLYTLHKAHLESIPHDPS